MGEKLRLFWSADSRFFLGVAFFVKYLFDNNFIPAELRVAIGFAVGLGLLVGGVLIGEKIISCCHTRFARPVRSTPVCDHVQARAYYHFLTRTGAWWDALVISHHGADYSHRLLPRCG